MRLTLRNKLIGSFLIIALIFGIVSGIAYFSLNKIDDSYTDLINNQANIVSNSIGIENSVNLQSNAIRGVILVGDSKNIQNLNESNSKVDELITETLPLLESEEEKGKLNKISELNKQYKEIADQVVSLNENNNREQAIKLSTEDLTELVREMRTLTREIKDNNIAIMDKESIENEEMADSTSTLILIISLIAFGLAIMIGYVISKILSSPIIRMTETASKIASGDLTVDEIEVKTRDEIQSLAESFNIMTKNLKELIGEVSQSSEQVSSSAEELTASADQTSKATELIASSIEQNANGAQEQSNSAEETSHAMEEMAIGIQKIAENATNILENSTVILKQAEDGEGFVNHTVLQMDSIFDTVNESNQTIQRLSVRSNEIEEILTVIKSIADQTNLLALNAAIEAARAGDHGRGFAVVAEEVRKLAEESARNAGQIGELIHEIQSDTTRSVEVMKKVEEEVQKGRKVTSETKQKFSMILTSAKDSILPIEEMSSISEEMSASSEEITASVESIARVSKETAATSQNVAASAEEQLASMEEINASSLALSKLAEELQGLVRRFKI